MVYGLSPFASTENVMYDQQSIKQNEIDKYRHEQNKVILC